METVEFITYKRYKDKDVVDTMPDSPGIAFAVPRGWAEVKIQEMFNMTLEEFYINYTWDHSEILYYEAEDDEVLFSSSF